jgi:hypothetical protein
MSALLSAATCVIGSKYERVTEVDIKRSPYRSLSYVISAWELGSEQVKLYAFDTSALNGDA